MGKQKDTEQFKKEIFDLVSEEYTILEEYKNNKTKIKIRHNCKECNNYEYKVRPNAFLSGDRCPECAKKIVAKKQKKHKSNLNKRYMI